jgi:hypothetical protein
MPILSVCPNGYILLKQICYKVTAATQSWNQSLQSCSSDGAQMISISNPVDFILLRVLLGSVDLTEVWVGGTLNDVSFFLILLLIYQLRFLYKHF